MRSKQFPDSISPRLKVGDVVEDIKDNEAKVILNAKVHPDFAARIKDIPESHRILNTDVNFSILGFSIKADKDYEIDPTNNRLSFPATITRRPQGLDINPLSETVIKPDALVAQLILLDPDQRVRGEDLKELIKEIYEIYENQPELEKLLELDGTYNLSNLEFYSLLTENGVDVKDIQKFIFGSIRLNKLLTSITQRIKLADEINKEFAPNQSFILRAQGFTHPEAFGLFNSTEHFELSGSRIIYPRCSVDEYRFLINFLIKQSSTFEDLKIPVEFYTAIRRQIFGFNEYGDYEDICIDLESLTKIMTSIESYHSAEMIFETMQGKSGRRKAVFITNQQELEKLLQGDHSQVKTFAKKSTERPTNFFALAENPNLGPSKLSEDPSSFPEIQLLRETEDSGVLFCKYFPSGHVLRRLYEHHQKLGAIVFQAPSYSATDSVTEDKVIDPSDNKEEVKESNALEEFKKANPELEIICKKSGDKTHPLEEHIFFDAEKFIALREFHQEYPDIKIIWSHPGIERNLVFVDDGTLPMFAKPEILEYLDDNHGLDKEASELEKFKSRKTVRVSFCGSSTASADMSAAEKEAAERAFTKMYCDFISRKGKKAVGINGGGPDVMERNGKHLQELGAISVSSACDLGKAGQTRHTHWDAVLNQKGDEASFALREMVLMSGDIIHIAPGGIGTIQEILGGLAGNKTGMTAKPIFLVGREYWNKQVDQFVHSAKDGKIKSAHLSLLFIVDTPEEVREILENVFSDKRGKFLKEKTEEWSKKINNYKKSILSSFFS